MAARDVQPDEPCASGVAVRDLRWALEEILGRDVVAAGLARAPREAREAYVGATTLSWVPYRVLNTVHDAIAEEAGVPVEELAERAVPMAVERAFKTIWRVFLRFTGDDALIKRTPMIYAKSRSHGHMTARLVAPGHAESIVTGFPGMPDRDLANLRLSVKRFLELAGRREVSVEVERTPDDALVRSRFRG